MNEKPKNIILKTLVGSRAYGLANEDSDSDYCGIFVAPTRDIAGLHWHPSFETWTNESPVGDDEKYYEIAKFINMCLKGNPNTFEVLWGEPIEKTMYANHLLISGRNNFYSSEAVAKCMSSFVRSSIHELKGPEKSTNFKTFRTAFTKGYGIVKWLNTGEYTFDALDLDTSESIKDGYVSRQGLIRILEGLHTDLDQGILTSRLPKQADMAYAENTLNEFRNMYR